MTTRDEPILFDLSLPALTLEAGARVRPHIVRGWLWGSVADRQSVAGRAFTLPDGPSGGGAQVVVRRTRRELDELAVAAAPPTGSPPLLDSTVPTVLVVHALTGDMRAGGSGGFWEPLIGPGHALDPTSCRLLCLNNLGSCYGTSGPADEGFPRRSDDQVEGSRELETKGAFQPDVPELPATITPWDQARSILLALDRLGLDKVALATGGSLGGMIVLCLAALAPERFERIAPIGACEAASPWVIGWNHVGRQALLLDPGFPDDLGRGLEIAREIAHLTYRAEPGLWMRQGRRMGGEAAAEGDPWSPRWPYSVQTYLEHQGRKLRRRFDGLAYVAQLDAMDHHDLSRPPAPPEPDERWTIDGDDRGRLVGSWGLGRIRASALAVAIDTDELFAPAYMAGLCKRLDTLGVHAEMAVLESPHGHDSFLIEWDQLGALLQRALELPLSVQGRSSDAAGSFDGGEQG